MGGGHEVVPHGGLAVPLQAGAVGEVVSGDELGVSVPEVGGLLEPRGGHQRVLLDLLPAGVELPQHDHGIGLSERCRFLEELQSEFAVLLGPDGADVAPGESVHCGDRSPAGGCAIPCVGHRPVLLHPDPVHVAASDVVHPGCVARDGELVVDGVGLLAIPLDAVAVLVAVTEADGGGCVSLARLLLEHRRALGPVTGCPHSVEDAQGGHAAGGVVAPACCGGVVGEGACRIELGSNGELLEPAEHVGRIRVVLSGPLLEVVENGAVLRRLVRLVVVGQPSVRLRVALHCGPEHPHAALRRVGWDGQAVGVAEADDELSPGVTPFGCADVPTEGGRFVRVDALAERVTLP